MLKNVKPAIVLQAQKLKVVLEGYRRCPDSHDLSECHHLYDISLTVLTLTPKNYLWKPSGITLKGIIEPLDLTQKKGYLPFHHSTCMLHTIQTAHPPHGQWQAPIASWRVYYLHATRQRTGYRKI